MAFVARKPFVFKGVHYRPGEVVHGFPQDFFRAEGFIRSGMIIEVPDAEPEEVKPVAKKASAKKSAKVVEVIEEADEEAAEA
jgi:hypothetical protein